MRDNSNTYDVIIIGSGIGGLSAASILAQQYGKRVLVLEQHFKAGGFTHIFKREGKFLWDVGLHYVGGMEAGNSNRAMFDYITRKGVTWKRMPEVYDVFKYSGLTFRAHAGEERLKSDLQEQFPDEYAALEHYFKDIKNASSWFGRHMFTKALKPGMKPITSLLKFFGAGLALQTTREYLDKRFRDEKLKAVLVSQWGDYGQPPSHSPFCIHATVASHYFEGAYYPEGGSGTIAASIVPILEEAGGKVLLNHTVEEVLIKHGTAYGVKAKHKQGSEFEDVEYYAAQIISTVGVRNTYLGLVPESYPLPFREELRNSPLSAANVTLYIGLKESPETIGIVGENYWIYNGFDHDATFDRRNELIDGKPGAAYVSFPSLKDTNPDGHTAEIIAFCDAEPFAQWADQPWKKRGEDYEALKQHISESLLDYVEERLPGFKDLVAYTELSTPLSTEHFTRYKGGSFYGVAARPERLGYDWLGIHTPIRNFYLAGQDATMSGIVPSMFSGVFAAAVSAGGVIQIPKLFKAAMDAQGKQD